MVDWIGRVSVADQVYLLLMLAVLIILLVRYRSLEANLRPLIAFVGTHFLMEFTADYLNYNTTVDNVFLYHLFAPVSYSIISVILYRTLNDSYLQKYILLSALVYPLLALCYTLFWEPLTQINSLAYMTESVFVIGWCFVYFRRLLQRDDDFYPEKDRTFWVITAFLMYFIGNFFVVGAINYFVYNKLNVLTYEVYYYGYVFNYLLYTTLGVVCLLNFSVRTHE